MKDDDSGKWLLSETVRATRGCHIEAEKRLLERGALANHANLYYGCWSAVLTVLALDTRYSFLDLPAACFATAVALWAAYSAAERYDLRARDFYSSYLALQKLWWKCIDIEAQDDKDPDVLRKYIEAKEDYAQILSSTENHTEMDYVRYKYDMYRKQKEESGAKIPKDIMFIYYRGRVQLVGLRLFVYIGAPFILLMCPRIIEWFKDLVL